MFYFQLYISSNTTKNGFPTKHKMAEFHYKIEKRQKNSTTYRSVAPVQPILINTSGRHIPPFFDTTSYVHSHAGISMDTTSL